MIDVFSLAEQDTQLRKVSAKEHAGACPSCYGNDRFRVRWDGNRWVFMCRGCYDAQEIVSTGKRAGEKRGWGDAIDYLRHYKGLSFQDAQSFVNDGQNMPAIKPHTSEQAGYRSDAWQCTIGKTVLEYAARLWTEEGTIALDYVRARGLHDDIIKDALIGYSTKGNIPRLTIPVQNDRHYVAVYRRDLRTNRPEQEPRWKDVSGGTKSELYMADSLKRKGYPVILVESAIDALSIWQECKDLVNVVATGSADCGKHIKWIAKLARTPLVLVAFDADKAGDKNATYWLDRLRNAKRLRPILHDVNDMLVQGWDIRKWIQGIINDTEVLPCVDCGMDAITAPDDVIFSCAENGDFYCPQCWKKLQNS